MLIEHRPGHLTKGPVLPLHYAILASDVWRRVLMIETKITAKGIKMRVLKLRAIVTVYSSNSITMSLILQPQDQVPNKAKCLALILQEENPRVP